MKMRPPRPSLRLSPKAAAEIYGSARKVTKGLLYPQEVHKYRLTQARLAEALLRDPNIAPKLAVELLGNPAVYPLLSPKSQRLVIKIIYRHIKQLAQQQLAPAFDANNPNNPDSALNTAQANEANNLIDAEQQAAAQQDQNNIQASLDAGAGASDESEEFSLEKEIAIAAATLGGSFVLQDQENVPHDLQMLQKGTETADHLVKTLEDGEQHENALKSLIKDLFDFADKDAKGESPNPEKETEHEASNLPTPRPGAAPAA